MTSSLPFIAVLIAGGQSTRMGCDKGELILRGQPLWEHQLEKLGALLPDEVLISVRQKKVWNLPEGVDWLEDCESGLGPMAGLVAALRIAEGRHVLLLSVDMAAMTVDFLQSILSQCRENQGSVGFHDALFEPQAAVYPASALSDAEAVLKEGDRSFQSLIRNLEEKALMNRFSIDEQQRGLFQSFNKPEAWMRFLEEG